MEEKYRCPAEGCGASFDSPVELLKHMEEKHGPPKLEKLTAQVGELGKSVGALAELVEGTNTGIAKSIANLDERVMKLERSPGSERGPVSERSPVSEGVETELGGGGPEEMEVGQEARMREATRTIAQEAGRTGAPSGWQDPRSLGPFLSGVANLVMASRGPPSAGGELIANLQRRSLEEDIKTIGAIRRAVGTAIVKMFPPPRPAEHE